MTSPLTEAKTRKYFQEKNYFGLDPKNVIFFNQVRSAIHTDARQSTTSKHTPNLPRCTPHMKAHGAGTTHAIHSTLLSMLKPKT